MVKKVRSSETRGSESTAGDLAKTPIEINGKTYFMCFDFAHLAEAENFFRRQGHNVNLLISLPELNLHSTRQVFPCLLRTFHPELSFEDAQALVSLQSVYFIASAIVQVLNPAAVRPAQEIQSAEAKV